MYSLLFLYLFTFILTEVNITVLFCLSQYLCFLFITVLVFFVYHSTCVFCLSRFKILYACALLYTAKNTHTHMCTHTHTHTHTHTCTHTHYYIIYYYHIILYYIPTRYQFFLQLKEDILSGKLETPFDTTVQLAAYALQCEYP